MPDQAHAWKELAGHRWWPLRACAPAEGAPAMARGDRTVPVTVWLTPDGESQVVRRAREEAAVALCGRCPVREACLAYALGDSAGPYERWDVWGGMTANDRRTLLQARARSAAVRAPQREVRVLPDLDRAVLQALAAHRSPGAVAAAAGMTVTRANWHRSRLVTYFGLNPATTTRMRLIYTARVAGVLDPTAPYLTDRTRLIAAVPSEQSHVTRSRGVQLPLPGIRLDKLARRTARTTRPAPEHPAAPAPAGTTSPARAPRRRTTARTTGPVVQQLPTPAAPTGPDTALEMAA